MLGQFFLSREVIGKDTALSRLNRQIEELTSLLALERARARRYASIARAASCRRSTATQKERDRLQGLVDCNAANANAAGGAAAAARQALDAEKQLSARALAQVDILNQQIAALRRQLAALEEALEASEKRDKESKRASPTSARGSTWRWRRRCRSWRAIAPISSGACATFSATGRACGSSATASCSSRKCCSTPAAPISTRRAAPNSTSSPPR